MKALFIELEKLIVVSTLAHLVSEVPVVKLALLYLPHLDIADQREIVSELNWCSIDCSYLVLFNLIFLLHIYLRLVFNFINFLDK